MKLLRLLPLGLFWLLIAAASLASGYRDHPQAQALIQELVEEEGFDRGELEGLFAGAERKDSILEAIARPAEKTKPWHEYRDIFVTDTRTDQGLEFYRRYASSLQRAEREFGVPAEIIVAIIGVETRYGRNKGSCTRSATIASRNVNFWPSRTCIHRAVSPTGPCCGPGGRPCSTASRNPL